MQSQLQEYQYFETPVATPKLQLLMQLLHPGGVMLCQWKRVGMLDYEAIPCFCCPLTCAPLHTIQTLGYMKTGFGSPPRIPQGLSPLPFAVPAGGRQMAAPGILGKFRIVEGPAPST